MRNTKYLRILVILPLFLAVHSSGQQKYWVSFTQKTATHFDPYSFFDSKTIENRKLTGQPLSDWYDLPVDPSYIKAVCRLSDSTGYSSRWLNGMAVYATNIKIKKIAKLAFVKEVMPMGLLAEQTSRTKTKPDSLIPGYDPEDKVCEQVYGLQGEEMALHHLTGKGIRIAVLDVGFVHADIHPAFEYLRSHKGIVMTWDFLHKTDKVYNYGAHGTAVLSCIAGYYKGFKMGLAPDAEFLLARTERESSEFKDEEDAWVAAAEWAEQHGAQIISSSLGYTYQRYFYKDMNGQKSVAARGAEMAAHKGLLVCIAAGNEGQNRWHFIATPADADSILTVGGYDPGTRIHIGFSSFGPSSDHRAKPNVIASGRAWVATPKNFGYEEGTSFSTPLMAGFAACVWQKMHGKTNMEVFDKIQQLGSLYPYFDYAHGYGRPQAGYLFTERKQSDSTFSLFSARTNNYDSSGNDVFHIKISPEYFKDSFQIHNLLKNKYLYTKITGPQGNIKFYNVIKIEKPEFIVESISAYLQDEFSRSEPVKTSAEALRALRHDPYTFPGWVLTAYFDGFIINYKL